MLQLITEQRVFIVKNYLQTQSSTTVQNACQARFPGRNSPAPSTILRNVHKYLNAGTSLNLKTCFPLQPYRSETYRISLFREHSGRTNDMDIIEYATFRYYTVEVENGLNKGNSGRRRSIRTAENIEGVRDVLQQNPHVSARRNPVPISPFQALIG